MASGRITGIGRTIILIPPPKSEEAARSALEAYMRRLHLKVAKKEPMMENGLLRKMGDRVKILVWVVPAEQHSTGQWYAMGSWFYNKERPELNVIPNRLPKSEQSPSR